ncbi:MAG: hypothetical protein ABJB76_07705 [Candidatus Nitrosocosmicus sp.]
MSLSYKLFGILATHSPESCPLNNSTSREVFKQIYNKLESNIAKYGIKKIVSFYMSVLEHEWFIVLEANSAHDIEQICIDAGISSFNTVKIVPLTNFHEVVSKFN